ncbi:MAG: hypothetical protein A3D59_03000, partial [Candidatus Wildermuthbacteria bacterium RIFCSPHIGHO2_02_FULL_47_17]
MSSGKNTATTDPPPCQEPFKTEYDLGSAVGAGVGAAVGVGAEVGAIVGSAVGAGVTTGAGGGTSIGLIISPGGMRTIPFSGVGDVGVAGGASAALQATAKT